ncbi:MAG: methyltransferase domain-containing protein [Pirellula sp.]|nr:methyltransferase domain-containing protein [Pirellula sp.]
MSATSPTAMPRSTSFESSPICAQVTPLKDVAKAIDWLSDSTQKSRDEVIETLRNEARNLGTTVRKELRQLNLPRYKFTPELMTYYQSSRSFVFESFAWNTTRSKEILRNRVGKSLLRNHKPGSKVLCYGDGLGFDSTFLSLLGFDVTYYEPGEPCVRFAKRVFQENGVDVTVCQDLNELKAQTFDAIVCLDVLEHVPDPPDLVSSLVERLVDGGTFVAHAPFWYIHPDVSTHLVSNTRFSGRSREIYHRSGLREVDAGFLWCPLILKKCNRAKPKSLAAKIRIRFSQFLLAWSRFTTWPTVAVVRTVAKARPRIQL